MRDEPPDGRCDSLPARLRKPLGHVLPSCTVVRHRRPSLEGANPATASLGAPKTRDHRGCAMPPIAMGIAMGGRPLLRGGTVGDPVPHTVWRRRAFKCRAQCPSVSANQKIRRPMNAPIRRRPPLPTRIRCTVSRTAINCTVLCRHRSHSMRRPPHTGHRMSCPRRRPRWQTKFFLPR